MTELNGTLEGIGLQPLLGFLESLHTSGTLVVEDGPWAGNLMLAGGQLVGASFGAEQGLAALDAIFLALPSARFAFSDQVGACEINLVLEPEPLRQHLSALAREAVRLSAAVPSLECVPRVLPADDADGGRSEITVGRSALNLLLALDGQHSVASLARQRGLLPTLRALADLVELGLVLVERPSTAPAPAPEPMPAPTEGSVSPPAAAEPPRAADPDSTPTVVSPAPSWRAGLQARRAVQPPAAEGSETAHAPTTPVSTNGRRFWR